MKSLNSTLYDTLDADEQVWVKSFIEKVEQLDNQRESSNDDYSYSDYQAASDSVMGDNETTEIHNFSASPTLPREAWGVNGTEKTGEIVAALQSVFKVATSDPHGINVDVYKFFPETNQFYTGGGWGLPTLQSQYTTFLDGSYAIDERNVHNPGLDTIDRTKQLLEKNPTDTDPDKHLIKCKNADGYGERISSMDAKPTVISFNSDFNLDNCMLGKDEALYTYHGKFSGGSATNKNNGDEYSNSYSIAIKDNSGNKTVLFGKTKAVQEETDTTTKATITGDLTMGISVTDNSGNTKNRKVQVNSIGRLEKGSKGVLLNSVNFDFSTNDPDFLGNVKTLTPFVIDETHTVTQGEMKIYTRHATGETTYMVKANGTQYLDFEIDTNSDGQPERTDMVSIYSFGLMTANLVRTTNYD